VSVKRQHPQCINGHYRYRRRWPSRVRSVASGEFFIRHLGTASLDEAVRLRPASEIEFHSEIDRLDRLVDAQPRALSKAEATMMVSRWFVQAVRADAEHDLLSAPADADERMNRLEGGAALSEIVSDMLGSGDLEVFEVHAERLLADQGIVADQESPGFRFLSQLMARADKERHLLASARLRGDYGYQPADPVLAEALKEPERAAPRHTIGTLIEAFKKDRADKWSPSSTAAYVPVERVMREVFGNTRELSTITREDGRRLFEIVKLLPRGLGKHPRLRGVSVLDAIKFDMPKLSPKSVNATYLASMSATFKFAIHEQWMVANPLSGLSVVDPVADADKRDPFTTEQLNRIFSGHPWSPREEAPRGKPLHYWGPLIALFLGMRRGEIAQLAVEDVGIINGVSVILVRSRERLKTTNARRMMPVHPELIRLGFLNYVARRRAAKATQLWEGEQPDSRGKWGDGFSDWFLRLLKDRSVSGTKLTLHSFRHNFQDRLREAGLHGTALGQELAGRSKGGSTSNNYGSGFPTQMLAEAIAKVAYPGLRLPLSDALNGDSDRSVVLCSTMTDGAQLTQA
jgi:integrase